MRRYFWPYGIGHHTVLFGTVMSVNETSVIKIGCTVFVTVAISGFKLCVNLS